MITKTNLKLLKKIISIQSITGCQNKQKKIMQLVENSMPKFFYKQYLCKNGYYSAIFTPSKSKKIDVLLLAHTDVVPANTRLFSITTKNNSLYGRGVYDMKGPLVCMIESLNQYYKNNSKLSIGLLLTSDEERGGFDGAGYLTTKNLIIPKIVICPDGGNITEIVTEEKGVLDIELELMGISAHTAYPWEGKNAANQLSLLLSNILDKYNRGNKIKWDTTANIINFESKHIAGNVTPDFAKARISFRYVSTENIKEIINYIKNSDKEIKVNIIAQADPLKVYQNNKLIKLYKKTATLITKRRVFFTKCSTGCDGRFFSSKGIPVIITRPDGGNLHKDNEWIYLSSMSKFVDILLKYYQEIENII